MLNDVRLYISNQLLDFNTTTDIFYNWQETDYSNPSTIKNSYSKTITVDGTKNNNNIFGQFWNLERFQLYGNSNVSAYFNPSYKVPFKLYVDGNLYESGYVKLQNVKKENGIYKYEIGLFGGLGSFFGNLSTNYIDGSVKTLADLKYRHEAYNEEAPEEPTDLDFIINRDTVSDAWENIDGFNKWGIINFATTYNGNDVSKFDANKVLINTSGLPTTHITTAVTEDNETYLTVSGLTMGSLDEKIDMYDAKDLRSYMLTPVVKVSSIINSLTYKENTKGEFDEGYEVVLDETFFNDNNPYYHDTWMTLPKITTLSFSFPSGASYEVENWIQETTASTDLSDFVTWVLQLQNPITDEGGKVKMTFNLRVWAAGGGAWGYDTLYDGVNTFDYEGPYYDFNEDYVTTCFATQLYTTSTASGITGNSEVILNSTPVYWNIHEQEYGHYNYSDAIREGKIKEIIDGSEVITIQTGKWQKTTTYGLWFNDYTYNLECDLAPGTKCLKINIQSSTNQSSGTYKNVLYSHKKYSPDISGIMYPFTSLTTDYSSYAPPKAKIVYLDVDNTDFYSNKYVTQSELLTTSYSISDWLVSYCKMFGLYIHKDVVEDKVYIDTRDTFYKRDVIKPLTVDYSKPMNIKPLYIDNRFYSLTQKVDKSDTADDYEKTFSKVYGSKVLDTGYAFTQDTKEIMNLSINGGIMANKQSLYNYRNIYGIPPYYYNGFKQTLYKNGTLYPSYANVDKATTEIVKDKKDIAEIYRIDSYNPSYPYSDLFPKLDLESGDKAVAGNNILLFHTGNYNISNYGFYLTDDLPIMASMNNNPCWILTNAEYLPNGTKIANKVTTVPAFTRYWLRSDKVIMYSLDFGSPRQFYVKNVINNDNRNLYSLFFKKYYGDLFDVNTKVLSCYIKTDGILNADSLRNFYWFDNGIWRINKIIDYNPYNQESVKVELIKVQDVENMTSEVASTGLSITIEFDEETIGSEGGTVTGWVRTSDYGPWEFEVIPDGVTVFPNGYGTSSDITVTIPSFTATTASSRELTFIVSAGDTVGSATITQSAAPYLSVTPVIQTIPATATLFVVRLVNNYPATIQLDRGIIREYDAGDRLVSFSIPENVGRLSITYSVKAKSSGLQKTALVTQQGA